MSTEILDENDQLDKDVPIPLYFQLKEIIKELFQTTGNERVIIPKGEYKSYLKFWNKVLDK